MFGYLVPHGYLLYGLGDHWCILHPPPNKRELRARIKLTTCNLVLHIKLWELDVSESAREPYVSPEEKSGYCPQIKRLIKANLTCGHAQLPMSSVFVGV